ncbi:HlyD family efflux transporter periplasmic adaptor subunit [Nibrella saemangeumensis]|uniref:HlyD family efflux transporter periplasmic adaptor subunit n=1 Tax=Nibrella saemangeumensis TaxID=1084526 RepID=A0ABP8N8R8_9BACT
MLHPSNTFVELRSEEVQEVLSRAPKWILRWGVTVVFAVLALVFWGAWVIRYPELVKASFRLTSANAPKAVIARTDGKLTRLLVQEGQAVKAGTVLAYLESTARHDEVLKLSSELTKAWTVVGRPDNLENLHQLRLSNYHQLGELQSAYQTFEQSRIQLRAYLTNGIYSKKLALLRQEIKDLIALADNLREQCQIQAQDIQLAQEDYQIQQQLYREKVISRLDLKREGSKNIARRLPYQQTILAIISNLTAQRARQKELLELDKQVAEERDKFLQALSTLRSAADSWIMKYVLTAPVAGRVSFPITLQENQLVAVGQELVYVAPPCADYFGELQVPQQNAGKVWVGQLVLIKFAGFPYQEFGAVRGRITAIANVPLKDSVFMAKVGLPNGLNTTYGRSLTVKIGMTASAEIITNDSRLLGKLLPGSFFQQHRFTR